MGISYILTTPTPIVIAMPWAIEMLPMNCAMLSGGVGTSILGTPRLGRRISLYNRITKKGNCQKGKMLKKSKK
jgi:hypothetical protein